jgi:methyl acetate hydrolase
MPVATSQPLSTAPVIDAALAKATADPYNGVPRAVFLAASSSSPRIYSGAGGYARVPSPPVALQDLDAHAETEKIDEKSIFELFSCTKLVGAIAALQLVEQGKIALDDDASKYVPQLADVQIFEKWDEEKNEPVLSKNEEVVTVRMLLTHTSGAVYFFHDIKNTMRLSKHFGINAAPYGEDATPVRLPFPLSFPVMSDLFLPLAGEPLQDASLVQARLELGLWDVHRLAHSRRRGSFWS